MTRSESGTSALSDSWASIGDIDSCNEDDLRSEITDVGSLLDVHSSNDVRSVVDEEMDGPPFAEDEYTQPASAEDLCQDKSVVDSILQMPDPANSGIMRQTNPSEYSTILSDLPIQDAQSATQPFSERQNQELRSIFNSENDNSSGFYHTVHSEQRKDGLDLDMIDYFKVLLLGTNIEQFRPQIQRKLGDALVSRQSRSFCSTSSSISRFHLVPNTFGPGAEPEYADLVAIDKQIDFECYDQADIVNSKRLRGEICLRNSQTNSHVTSQKEGSHHVVTRPRWILPDLAIICVGMDSDGSVDDASNAMITFAERLHIPTIFVRSDRGWSGCYPTQVQGSLLETIECQREGSNTKQVIASLPVDMVGFMSLDSEVLNQHIGFLTTRMDDKDESNTIKWKDDLLALWSDSRFATLKMPRGRNLARAVVALLLVVSHVSLCWYKLYHLASNNELSTTSAIAPFEFITETPSSVAMPLRSSDCMDIVAGSIGIADDQSGRSVVDAATQRHIGSSVDASRFSLSIAGPGQMLVRIPTVAKQCKERSDLLVSVTQADRSLPVTVQELFGDVYVLRCDRKDIHGNVEVRLSMLKPRMNETITLDFGGVDHGPLDFFINAISTTDSKLHNAMNWIAERLSPRVVEDPKNDSSHNPQMPKQQQSKVMAMVRYQAKREARKARQEARKARREALLLRLHAVGARMDANRKVIHTAIEQLLSDMSTKVSTAQANVLSLQDKLGKCGREQGSLSPVVLNKLGQAQKSARGFMGKLKKFVGSRGHVEVLE